MAKKERKEKKEKPLDKMTATELRKYALDLGEISGVHGMNKEELLSAIKQVKGIKEEGKHTEKVSMRDLKEKAAAMRGKQTGSHRRQGTPGEDRHPAQESQPHEEADPQGGVTGDAVGSPRPRAMVPGDEENLWNPGNTISRGSSGFLGTPPIYRPGSLEAMFKKINKWFTK